jgi:hypothetical protein
VAMATHEAAAAAAAAVVRQEVTMQSNAYLQVSLEVVATWTAKSTWCLAVAKPAASLIMMRYLADASCSHTMPGQPLH